MEDNERFSYTAASSFPIKILLDSELVESIEKNKMILPRHLQLYPTNRCNQNCPYCSCSERDKKLELDFYKIMDLMIEAKELGCKSVTISGGGEPILHKNIEDIIKLIDGLGIKIGLVSNGLELHTRLSKESLGSIVWCRVSYDDYRTNTDKFLENLEKAVMKAPYIDWAFSYVLTKYPNFENLEKIIQFANEHNFTHVRVVTDLLEPYKVPIAETSKKIKEKGIDDSLVIYQDRSHFTPGVKECYISLLKPVITAGGYIVGCCGWQYRHYKPSRSDMDGDYMGKIEEFGEIIRKQKYYDGSKCYRCYYSDYNNILKILLKGIKHKEFL
ncbi:MAG: hypothetical protein DRM99_04155 [Thermoplasmata archaeon]|nr:MAG: hypothetical protein DRM99_04155 [Thermoplasmata archaeon]